MGFLEELGVKRMLHEGAGKPAPESGIRRYFFLLYTHFWELCTLSLLFTLFCLPVVTIPAALCGVNRVCVKLVREGNCFLWYDFITEFKSSFKKSLVFGAQFLALFLVCYYFFSLGTSNAQNVFGMLFYALGLITLAAALLYGSYSFVLLAMLPLNCRDISKNARALIMLEGRRDLGVLLCHIIAFLLTGVLYPLSLLLQPVFLLALTQFTLCFLINTPVQKRIVQPFENAHKSS